MVFLRRPMLAATALLISGGAQAADMPDFGYAPPPVVQEFGSNWYLRGDVGYVFQSSSVRGNATLDYLYTDEPNDFYNAPFGGGSLDDTWTVGGGFGVKMTEWLRFDATADYRANGSADGLGYFSVYDSFNGLWSQNSYARDVPVSLSSTLLLANAYLDLGTWSGLTPYVGAGIGGAYLDLRDMSVADVGSTNFDGQWSFAWALMAGASFQVSSNWSIDVGYRYSSIAGTSFSSRVSGVDGTTNMGDIVVRVDDITSQEVRIGARYMID